MVRRSDGSWICARCGGPLVPVERPRRSAARLLQALGGVAMVGLAAALAPPLLTGLLTGLRLEEPPAPLATVLPPTPAGLEGIDKDSLLRTLAVADAAWTPRAERLGDGRTRYHYKRRSGDPPLSLAEIRALMANPPTFATERNAIVDLLATLGRVGVRIQLTEPRKRGAAGEWDPRARTLRIKPSALNNGSAEFAKVLNHEAIHVAQSCRNGHVRAIPRPLGLDDRLPLPLQSVLGEDVYRSAGPLERQLEREAYANQHQLDLGASLVRRYCRPAA
jgi:hypothetical protein